MTPAARIAAAIGVLDRILDGAPAERTLLNWSRSSRFAGSGDRAAVRDLVFDSLRRRDSRALLGGGLTGRGLMLGMCREEGVPAEAVFTGEAHAPTSLTPGESAALAVDHDPLPDDLPDFIRPCWDRVFGARAGEVAAMMRDRAPVYLRVNPRLTDPEGAIARLAGEGIVAVSAPQLDGALQVLSGERRIARSSSYGEGLVELQDLSAQLACAALPLAAGQQVLDYCAGGGGKILALASRSDGSFFAHDISAARMGDLPQRARRAAVRVGIVPSGALGRRQFDLVVADVPCSGSGTWRRTPDAKWRLTEADVTALHATQSRILHETARLVRPGGHLAYMTCSVLASENEERVAGFLAQAPGFVAKWQRRWSPLDAGDGFFAALLQRDGERGVRA